MPSENDTMDIMPDKPRKTYTDREIDTFHQQIIKELKAIKAEVKKTNGRVRFNEKMVYLAIGGLTVLTFFIANDLLTI